MGKRNRDKLLEQSMYDMLLKMNENLRENLSRTTFLTCIMDALYSDYSGYERIMRCKKHKYKCDQCLQSWMNEQPF
jgi:hypothetical protein